MRRGSMYPEEVDICNCGADFGSAIPRPELLATEGLERGTLQWQMQTQGAALYWHLATTPGKGESNPDMLRGKNVLEVASGRGGGARYLAEVAGPRSYLGVDIEEDEVELCRQRQKDRALPSLAFDCVGAAQLEDRFAAASFDVVLCVQSINVFKEPGRFIQGAKHVLKPGGLLILCDLLSFKALQDTLRHIEESGLVCKAALDASDAVNKVGICTVTEQRCYAHIIAQSPGQ